MTLIVVLLALAAIYSGGMWAYLASFAFRHDVVVDVERETFHLGLCFILSLGFIGLINGGA